MNKNFKGFSLIEMIIFIVITGIAVTAMLLSFQTVLKNSPLSNNQNTAVALAQGRMDLIFGQKQELGFNNYTDPCVVATPPSYCTLTGYTVTSTISSLIISGDSNYNSITVTVKNSAGVVLAVLNTLVGS